MCSIAKPLGSLALRAEKEFVTDDLGRIFPHTRQEWIG